MDQSLLANIRSLLRALDSYEQCLAEFKALKFQLKMTAYTGFALMVIAEDCGNTWTTMSELLVQERRRHRVSWNHSDVSILSSKLGKLQLHGKIFSAAREKGISAEEVIAIIKFHQRQNWSAHQEVDNLPLEDLNRFMEENLHNLDDSSLIQFLNISKTCKEALKKTVMMCHNELATREN
jgi:hypothetical protein